MNTHDPQDSDLDAAIPWPHVPKHIPGRPHNNTILRWANEGYNGVRLKTFHIASKRFTTRRYIQEFQDACTRVAPENRGVQQSARTAEDATLDAMGI